MRFPSAAFRATCLSLALAACLCASGCNRPGASQSRYPPGPESGTPLRGGSAVFVRETDFDYLDPALSYTTYSSPVIGALARTLLGYPRQPGPAFLKLVPDMAEGMPAVLEGGRVYAFKVRAAERFGAPLHRHVCAADFKYAIERLFRVDSPGVGFFTNVTGAEEFQAHRAAHIAGLVARGDSLYVRLNAPNEAFLYVMAMNFASPVPREVAEKHPLDYSGCVVSSGPYDLAEFTPRRRVRLVRNPDCPVQGFLDSIEVRIGVTAETAVAQIRRGEVDGGFFELPASEYARLRRDPATREELQVANDLSLYYVALNTQVKPFDDPRVREAVAWAVDRGAMVKVWCGKGEEAFEVLPDGLDGFAPGRLHRGPDPARARELLRQAGFPRGLRTRLLCRNEEPDPRTAEVLQAELAEAGIDAKIEVIDGSSYWTEIGRPANRFPMMLASWIIDYPDASNYFDVLMNGNRITDVRNNNYSMYNDPAVNRSIEAAMREPDPRARAAEWARIDRAVQVAAPIVPYVHARVTRFYSRRLGGYFYHPTRMLYLDRLYLKRPDGPVSAAAGATAGRGGRP